MSTNVFGVPVTNATVQEIHIGLPAASITAQHRAEVALTYINSGGKADDARRFVADLKNQYGNGTSTLCTIYNATGNNLTFTRKNTWEGSVWRSPYPQILQNGQWGAFLHVRDRLMGPSKEAVIYRGRNNAGSDIDFLLAWNTSRRDFQNRVYAVIMTPQLQVNWNNIDRGMEAQTNNYSRTTMGCFTSVSVGSGSSPYFVGIMTLAGLRSSDMAVASDVSTIFPSLDSQYQDEDEEEVDDSVVAASTPASE